MIVFVNRFYFQEMNTTRFSFSPLVACDIIKFGRILFFFSYHEENEVIFEETDTLISEMLK